MYKQTVKIKSFTVKWPKIGLDWHKKAGKGLEKKALATGWARA